MISTTLFSMDSALHDQLTRSQGSFLKTMEFLRISKKYKIPIRCSLTVTNQNLTGALEVIDFVVNNGFQLGFGYGIIPYENLDKIPCSDIKLNRHQLAQLFVEIQKKYPQFHNKNRIPDCSGGKHGYTIDAEGYLTACAAVPLRYGDLKQTPLKELFNKDILIPLKEKFFTIPSKCKECEASHYCSDSFCPAVSQKAGGDNTTPAYEFCELAFAIHNTLKEAVSYEN